jgi:hypothetical protein
MILPYVDSVPDDALDLAEICTCVFINYKTNVSCARLNLLSSFPCKKTQWDD